MSIAGVENNGRTGRPFRKGEPNPGFRPGQSGNPGGRPKGLARRIRDEVGADGGELVAIMLSIARASDVAARDRMQAVSWLADRAFGKAEAPERVLDDEALLSSMDLTKLSMDELLTFRAILIKATPDGVAFESSIQA